MADPFLKLPLRDDGTVLAKSSHIVSAQTVFTDVGKAFTEVVNLNHTALAVNAPIRFVSAATVTTAATADSDIVDVPKFGKFHLGPVDAGFQGPTFILGTETANSTVTGGVGNDVIIAGTGTHETLTGGAGTNIFGFVGPAANDVITDFKLGQDRIDIRDTPKTAVHVTSDVTGNAVVSWADNHITLAGVTQADLEADLRPSLITNRAALATFLETPIGSPSTLLPTPTMTILPPKELIG
jgi:hypothetical protein